MFDAMTRILTAGAAALCLSAMLAHEAKADAAACPATIPLGLTTALTGNLALLGTQARNGAEFAVDEINAAGGIAGKKLALTTEDTGASSTDALNAMNRIIEGKPLVIFGSMISPHVFAQTESVNKSETPFLVGATNAKITAQGSKWLFRTHVHDGQLADLIPEYLVKSLKMTKPGIMAVADDYGLGASKGIQAALAKLNVTPVAMTSYAPSDKDMSAQLLEIKDKGADSLILFGRPADVTLVMKQMGDLGIKLTTIGNASIVAQTTLNNLSAAEADGGYAIGGMIPQTSTDPKIHRLGQARAGQIQGAGRQLHRLLLRHRLHAEVDHRESRLRQGGDPRRARRHQGLQGPADQLPGRRQGRSRPYARHLQEQGQDAGTDRADQGSRVLDARWASSSSTGLRSAASTRWWRSACC